MAYQGTVVTAKHNFHFQRILRFNKAFNKADHNYYLVRQKTME